MKHNFNPNKVKSRNSYTFTEIAEIYGVHKQTVQVWRKNGLKVIDENVRPFLIFGEDLRTFIKEKIKKRKITLNKGEFYCTKCHAARRSADNLIRFEYTNKRLGKKSLMVNIKGNCENCGTVLTIFSSDRKIREMLSVGMMFTGQGKVLTGNVSCASNTNLNEVSKIDEIQYMKLLKKSC